MKQVTAGICLLALAVFCGCSSSDDDPMSNHSEPIDSADVDQAIQEFVLPAVNMLNPYATGLVTMQASARAAALGTARDCEPMTGFCETGTAEFCITGQDSAVFNFDSCTTGGVEWDGSITLTANSETSASVVYDLTVAGITITGGFSLTQQGDCFAETIDQFSYDDGETSTVLDGSLVFCPSSQWPDGDVNLTITDADVGSYLFEMSYDHSSTAGLVIKDLWAGGEILATCTVSLDAGTANCDFA